MHQYLVQPRFLSFAKNIGKNLGKNLKRKYFSCNYIQKFIDHTKQSATDALKTVSKLQKFQEIHHRIV